MGENGAEFKKIQISLILESGRNDVDYNIFLCAVIVKKWKGVGIVIYFNEKLTSPVRNEHIIFHFIGTYFHIRFATAHCIFCHAIITSVSIFEFGFR